MSLVSEALKKAEKEAAAREARAKGLPAPLETPLQPYRARRGQRRRSGLVPFVALLGIAAGIALVFAVSRRAPADAPAAGTVPAQARATAPEPVASPAPPQSPPTAPTPPSEAAPAAIASATSAEGPASPNATGSAPAPEPESRRAPPAARTKRGGEPFVRRVEFADGSRLELGGIAYSEAAPFAYLNGKLLAVGESTAGYTLVRILRDRVVVRGEEGELTILLKAR